MRRLGGTIILAAACAWCGCSGRPAEPAPRVTVEGKVIRDGRPVPLLLVTFHPQNPADPDHYDGGTAADGSFRVQCPRGSYKVTLNALPSGAGGDPGAGGLAGGAVDTKGPKDVPSPYRSKARTRLAVDVPDSGLSGVILEVK
jgi:hypothetical protein